MASSKEVKNQIGLKRELVLNVLIHSLFMANANDANEIRLNARL